MEEKNKKIWFKRKRYGWGWTPASLEGWIVIIVYLAIVVNLVGLQHPILPLIILTIILIVICYMKGETPRWTWGEDKKEIGK